VHADAANTDYSPVEGAADLSLAWQRDFEGSIHIGPLEWTINLGPTIDPEGRLYLTSTVADCPLQAIDGATGETLWCTTEVDRFAVSSSTLIDRDGRLFVADGEAMHAFDADGDVLWETPITGVPLSAQLTPEGRVIFVTHIGVVYVLDRATGEEVLDPVELIPGATWDPASGMMACARGTEDCPAANTLAVDLDTGRIFFTFWVPGAAQAGVRAMRYTEGPEPALTPLWANDSLPGGSGSSPDLSADGSRIYVNDNVDSIHALDAATGEQIWSFPIGYASGGSPSTSPDGLVMPAGGNQSPLLAVRDTGDTAELAWRDDAMDNKGIPTQTAGDKAYATVGHGPFRNDLVVVDARTGTELDREQIPGNSVFSVGTTIGPDGTVYVPTIVGGLYAYRPSPEPAAR
jgi:outer membrane protein assembly factor BamB